MTDLAINRIMNIPATLKVARVYKDTDGGFAEFELRWAHKLTKYFSAEPATAVSYKAIWYDGHIKRKGTLTVKRSGDFTFVPD